MALPWAICATFRANSLAFGMQVSTLSPRLTSILRNGQNHGRSQRISICPSTACMQRRITCSHDQPHGRNSRTLLTGWKINCSSNSSGSPVGLQLRGER